MGAGRPLTAGNACGQQPAAAKNPEVKNKPKRAYELGLASYTLCKFPLDRVLAMTSRVRAEAHLPESGSFAGG